MIRPNRPKLFLPFALERAAGTNPAAAKRTGTLPDRELRRIVAAMIG